MTELERRFIEGEGWQTVPAASGGSQTTFTVTLTDVDEDGPAVGAEFTIPGGTLADQESIVGMILAEWTSGPYTTLDLVAAGSDPLNIATEIFPTDDQVMGAFPILLQRVGADLAVSTAPPPITGSWAGWAFPGASTIPDLDFSQDIVVQLLVTLDASSVSNYWHPGSAYMQKDPLDNTGQVLIFRSAVTNPMTANLNAGGRTISNAQRLAALDTVEAPYLLSSPSPADQTSGALMIAGNTNEPDVSIITGHLDPSSTQPDLPTSGAYPGSLFIRCNPADATTGAGELWIKTGGGPTDWVRLATMDDLP